MLAVTPSYKVVCIYATVIHNETLFLAKPGSQWWRGGQGSPASHLGHPGAWGIPNGPGHVG